LTNSSSPKHSVSVAAAVINDDGHVLVIRRRDNAKWEPPGGVLDSDETILEGLAREVYEETGVSIQAEALTGVYKNMTRGIIALVFRCRPLNEPLGSTPEAQAVRWLNPTEIPSYMDEAYAVRILDALEPGPAQIRAHDGIAVLRDR
jgi:8-oxo-dGTP pyrophosphatase MutT (NUDIX family)